MALVDTVCRNIKPKEKPFKISDSGGLYLEIRPNGAKLWRLKYYFLKKEKLLALGSYPTVSLQEAREARDNAKKQLLASIDPSASKKAQKRLLKRNTTNTFKAVAIEWHDIQKGKWSEAHTANVLARLEKDIFPALGDFPIGSIETLDILDALRKIEKRDALDIAARCQRLCFNICRFAVQTGRRKDNPASELGGALRTMRVKHFAAIEPSEIPDLLKALKKEDVKITARTRRAIELSLLTFVRPGELRQCEISELDFAKAEWKIPAEKMKMRRDHIVPLSERAMELFKEQCLEIERTNTKYVFPSQNDPKLPMSDNTVRLALHRIGFKGRMTAHGFRALARTAIREELLYDADIIEVQLAHKPSGALGAAYDRTKFIKQRKQMMQDWSGYIQKLKEPPL